MRVIGIDPGKTGYIVELDSCANTARTMTLPFRPDEIICYRTIRKHFNLALADLIMLEKVSVQPQWSTCSGMTFGKIVGQIQMLISSMIFSEVSSRTWQKIMHLGFADNLKPKKKSEAAFYRLNPNYKQGRKRPSHDLIDAFLIACYGLKTCGENIQKEWKFEHINPAA